MLKSMLGFSRRASSAMRMIVRERAIYLAVDASESLLLYMCLGNTSFLFLSTPIVRSSPHGQVIFPVMTIISLEINLKNFYRKKIILL